MRLHERKEPDGSMSEFVELLTEINDALDSNEDRLLYFHNISPTLENITSYDFGRFDKDLKEGNISEDEMFLYKAMSLLRHRIYGFEVYRKNLSDINDYFKTPKIQLNGHKVPKEYRNLLQEFIGKAAELSKDA